MARDAGYGMSVIRQAARRRAKATSIRALADEIGMSYTGCRAFLGGGKPHPETRRRLVAWYSALKAGSALRSSIEDMDLAVDLLVRYIQRAGTPQMVRERMAAFAKSLLGEVDDESRRKVLQPLLEGLLTATENR